MYKETSCGAVVYQKIDGALKYLIIESVKGVFGFPKGHMEGTETEHETAAREIWEETRLRVRFLDGFRTEDYRPVAGGMKNIVYFLATYEDQTPVPLETELRSIRFLPYEEALEIIQLDRVKRVLREAHAFLTGAAAPTQGTIQTIASAKAALLAAYPHRIELHAHTSPVSPCSEVTAREVMETYYRLGYSAVTITNHFTHREDMTTEDYVDWYLADFEAARRHGEEIGIRVYLGAEIRFDENHNDYLIYGVDARMLREIYAYLPQGLNAFRRKYAMPDSVFIQAHPMRGGIEPIDPALLDGVEVFNMHPNHNSRVSIASLYAQENGISLVTAGSDFHHPGVNHEGAAAIRAAAMPADDFALAALLRSRNYLLETGRDRIVLP
ncbi:MAG: NUDIX domain-containing protein [Ruminococcaceae bacterium]|nr:NUDIX domain-containing protein [Oscillospiraceae bacterium]